MSKEKKKPAGKQEPEEKDEALQPETAESEENKKPSKEEELEAQLADQKDKYMRLYAEYDNYRKRTSAEKLQIYDDATASAVAELLPLADSLEMAKNSLKDKEVPEEFAKGMELIAQQLEKSFEKLSIEAFGEAGDTFDPNMHNAVSSIENEELGENVIAAVYQKGYKRKDKIIRHAMVQVANT